VQVLADALKEIARTQKPNQGKAPAKGANTPRKKPQKNKLPNLALVKLGQAVMEAVNSGGDGFAPAMSRKARQKARKNQRQNQQAKGGGAGGGVGSGGGGGGRSKGGGRGGRNGKRKSN
jgi:uncharacterized membrane protein YgcG